MAKRGGGGSNSSAAEFNSLATDIANPVTHSALDFFEKPSVLVNYESGFDKKFSNKLAATVQLWSLS